MKMQTGQNVGFGKEGELWLQGPNTMLGYLNRPAADAETLVTDKDGLWLRTGDIAYVDEDGYHFITDRFKEVRLFVSSVVAKSVLMY